MFKNKILLGMFLICLGSIKSYGFVSVTPNGSARTTDLGDITSNLNGVITNSSSRVDVVTDESSSTSKALYKISNTEYKLVLSRDITAYYTQEIITIVWGTDGDTKTTMTHWTTTIPGASLQLIDQPQLRQFRYKVFIPTGSKAGGSISLHAETNITESDAVEGHYQPNPSFSKPKMVNGVPIALVTERIPTISADQTNIDFGQVDVTSDLDKTVFSQAISIANVENDYNFDISYLNEVFLTNSTIQRSVPMFVDIVKDSIDGPSVGKNVDIKEDTSLYVKATLPGDSIYRQPEGKYTGSISIILSVN